MKVLVPLLCILAALVVFISGINMTTIRSQASVTGAGSIAEAYYQSMGWALIGVSIFLFGAGLGIGGIIDTAERKSENQALIKRFGNCPACSRRIPNEDKICSFCGTERLTKVPIAQPTTPPIAETTSPVEPPKSQVLVCSMCSYRNILEAKVCVKCGMDLQKKGQTQ